MLHYNAINSIPACMAYNIQCIEMCAYMREGASNNLPQPPHLLVLYRMSSISTTWATKTTNPNLIGLFQNMIPAPPEQMQLQTILCGSWIGRCFAQPYFHTMDTWGRSGRKKQLIPKPLSLTGAVAFDVICFISFTSPPAHQPTSPPAVHYCISKSLASAKQVQWVSSPGLCCSFLPH